MLEVSISIEVDCQLQFTKPPNAFQYGMYGYDNDSSLMCGGEGDVKGNELWIGWKN